MSHEPIDVVEFGESETIRSTGDARSPLPAARPLMHWRELCALALIVVLGDVTLFRGEGYAGYGVFVAGSAAALLLGVWRRSASVGMRWVLPMLVLISAKLIWNGNELAVVAGGALIIAAAMSLAGQKPFVLEGLLFASQVIPAGVLALGNYARCAVTSRTRARKANWLAILLPGLTLAMFSAIFVMANPDLLSWVSQSWTDAVRRFRHWLINYGPSPLEVVFWFGTAWIAAGLLRPLAGFVFGDDSETQHTTQPAQRVEPAPLFDAYRNTLAGVVVLFAVYLIFEFATLWFREFPRGFHYSGYAHEGAAWLTVALALATLTLSVVFQGRTLHDPRLATLRRWAGAWAIENLILAIAVYHRLFIYIGFNGMTRMRVIGLLGITAVVAGFILMLIKISRSRSFLWLVRRDLWALAFCVYLYAVLPVDTLTTWYNVRQILAGRPAASVQISVHPIRSEGLLTLRPLLQADDAIIREGIRSMLAEQRVELDRGASAPRSRHWTAWQWSDALLHRQLEALQGQLAPYQDAAARDSARDAFDQYAYQWY
jgi:hypothetical protein